MVDYERRGPVAVVTLGRPQVRNSVNNAAARQLRDAWERFREDDARVGVLTGAGEEAFEAGADLKAMDLEDRPEGYLGFTRMEVEKPTLAAVEGYCVAGGLEMALWCDLRVGAESSTYGCLERRFGVPLVDGGTQRLPRVVGLGRALDMILTGRSITAQTALEWGLINRVVPDGTALEKAVDMGRAIAAYPQAAVEADRDSVYRGLGRDLQEGLSIEAERGEAALEEGREGARRFAEGEGRRGEGVPGDDRGQS